MIKLLPEWALWAIAAALVALLGLQEFRINNLQVRWAEHQQQDAQNALKAAREKDRVYDYWQEENIKKDKTYDEAKRQFDNSVSTLVTDRDDLRTALRRFSERRSTCAPAPQGGTPVDRGDPIGVLAELLGRFDQTAEVYATVAESRKLTASACEARYDTLTKQSPSSQN